MTATLKPPAGIAIGPTGATGPEGATGPGGGGGGGAGATGATGAAGSNGATGATGTAGSAGTNGATGPAGTAGSAGAVGATGSTGPQGASGGSTNWRGQWVSGTSYVASTFDSVSDAGSSYVCILSTSGTTAPGADPTHWQILALVGGTGATGTAGSNGAAGTAGATGATGPAGTAGAAGAAGATGAAGTAGADGATGATGTAGAAGGVGATGTAGSAGTAGATGATGTAGSAGTQGATGTAGATGATGPVGGSITIPYTFSTTTTDSDPGAGNLRLNNATQNTATAIRADLADSGATDWTAVLDSLDDSTNTVKGYVRLVKTTDATKWLLFSVTAVDSSTGYRNITVANVGSSAASPFSNADAIVLCFDRTGDQGATGTAGAAGATGATGTAGTVGATGAGATGATGTAGTVGATGTAGSNGSAGAAGATGATGPSTVADNVFTLQDNTTASKQAVFELSGSTASTTTTIATSSTTARTVTLPDATDTLVGKATTDTLTNKRITRRVHTLTDAATVTPDVDSYDGGLLTALSQTTTIANPTGTPTNFQQYVLRIKSTASQTLTFGAQYRAGTDVALPTATSGSSLTDYYGFQWNSADSKWDLLAKASGF